MYILYICLYLERAVLRNSSLDTGSSQASDLSLICVYVCSIIGEACWWTIHPASKQRSEGEKVRIGDDLILVSVSSERYLVSLLFIAVWSSQTKCGLCMWLTSQNVYSASPDVTKFPIIPILLTHSALFPWPLSRRRLNVKGSNFFLMTVRLLTITLSKIWSALEMCGFVDYGLWFL